MAKFAGLVVLMVLMGCQARAAVPVDIEATVQARVAATMAAVPTATATPGPEARAREVCTLFAALDDEIERRLVTYDEARARLRPIYDLARGTHRLLEGATERLLREATEGLDLDGARAWARTVCRELAGG